MGTKRLEVGDKVVLIGGDPEKEGTIIDCFDVPNGGGRVLVVDLARGRTQDVFEKEVRLARPLIR